MSGPLAAALRVARESIGPEDLLLFAWLAIVGPALSAAFAGGPVFDLDSDRAPAVGLLYVVATVGGIACLLTRGLGEPPLAPDPGQSARGYAPFPFAAAVGLVGSTGVEKLGLGSGEWMLGVGFLAALVSFVGHGALPVLAPEARRALMAPYIVVAGGIFQSVMAQVWSGISWSSLFGPTADTAPFGPGWLLAIFVAGSAVFYVMFVFAPRTVALPESGGWLWLVRFTLFVAGTLLGVGWLRFALG